MTRPLNLGLGLLSRAEPVGMERAHWAEAHGYDSVWIPDGEGKMHALTLAGAVAATTQRIGIGTGIVPVFTHTPAVLASAAMTLAHLAPGRVRLGLGASSEVMMEQWHGIPFEKPLTRVRETVQVLRGMLAGERVEFTGKTLRTRGFRLTPPPPAPVPIHLAALRPNMLALAGELADGVILHLPPLQGLPRLLEHLAEGAARAGRTLEDIELVCRFNVVVGDDRHAVLEEARSFVARYFAAEVYRKYFAWCGFEEETEQAREGFAKGDRSLTASALTDELVSELCVVGTEHEVRERIRAYYDAGITSPIINPIATTPEGAERTFSAFADGAMQ